MRTLLLFLSLIILTGCKDTPPVNTPPETLKEALNASEFTTALAPLIDPSKLDTLKGKRAATPRLRKACYWLQMAHISGFAEGIGFASECGNHLLSRVPTFGGVFCIPLGKL